MMMFYQCDYTTRFVYLTFLILTIMTLLFLVERYMYGKRSKKRILIWSLALLVLLVVYTVLLDDHITPKGVENWRNPHTQLPIGLLMLSTGILFIRAGLAFEADRKINVMTVSERNIKEALDEVPLAICFFKNNGLVMLSNRRMQEISEMMSERIFLSYTELEEMLTQRADWMTDDNVYRFPDGTVCRYAEEDIVTKDGETYRVSNFFDITELDQKKTELEAQNEELRRMSVSLQKLKENVQLLAREEEILTFKTRWHDVMGEGLTAIRHALLLDQPQEELDQTLKRWSDAVTTIQRDNDDPDQRRDALGDLMRDAQGLRIQLVLHGEMPRENNIAQVFLLAMRNCLLNAAMHAQATELYVTIEETDEVERLTVRNNGLPPASKIVPRGGLVNVINYVERIGGTTQIQSKPQFELRITIPKKGEML